MKLQVLIYFFLMSCVSDLQERHYRSPDEVTGGFYDLSLDLFSSGKLELNIVVSKAVEDKESGVIWERHSSTVSGKWELIGQKIDFLLDEPKSVIDSIFLKAEININNKNVLVFSTKSDTAFIYGVPCILVDTQKK